MSTRTKKDSWDEIDKLTGGLYVCSPGSITQEYDYAAAAKLRRKLGRELTDVELEQFMFPEPLVYA